MSIRPIKSIIQSQPTIEGAGVKLRRAFGFGNTSDFDPFLLLDDFRNGIGEPDESSLAGSRGRLRPDGSGAGRVAGFGVASTPAAMKTVPELSAGMRSALRL